METNTINVIIKVHTTRKSLGEKSIDEILEICKNENNY
jgi:hypothetical protein